MNKRSTLPEKANKILNGILVVLILIAVRVWHLSVVQHEKKIEESKKPQQKTVIERSERATIYDRFGVALATNKVQYNAGIEYAPIRNVPRGIWKKDENGKRIKIPRRSEYITELAQKLAEELHLDPEWVEDLIHSKAAVLGNVPCLIKENISEEQYFRLKMMAKDWPGVYAEAAAKRCYPLGNACGDVVGYIGPISRREYDAITREMGSLRETLAAYEEGEDTFHAEGFGSIQEVKARLDELEKKAYRINDNVGKMGVEAAYDESLRGLCGKHVYLTDTHGNYLRELPGSTDPVAGSRLVLSVSSELQTFAQQLLAEYDSEPTRTDAATVKRRELIPEFQPWIKGGAIVALDARTAEVYALASYPTLDPNDFIRPENDPETIQKNKRVNQWMETDSYLGWIWDMRCLYTRDRYDNGYSTDGMEMGWKAYLDFILPKRSPVREVLEKYSTLKDAICLQTHVDQLISLFQREGDMVLKPGQIFDFVYQSTEDKPAKIALTLQNKDFLKVRMEEVKDDVAKHKEALQPYFSRLRLNYDKMLLIDLYRLAVNAPAFHPALVTLVGQMHLSEYRDACARFGSIATAMRKLIQEVYLEYDFRVWREEHFKEYLAQKRLEEKEANRKYARPYIEYLENIRAERFKEFWEAHQWEFIALFFDGKLKETASWMAPYAEALENWKKELDGGAHQGLEWVYHYHRLKTVTDEYNPRILIPFLKTLRTYDQLTRPLIGKYTGLRGDKERDLAAAFYPAYGFGFARPHAYRQSTVIGSIFKIIPAYEALRQRYLTLKERGESLSQLNPLTIIDDKRRIPGKGEVWNVGFTLEGKPIPMFYHGGRLPRSDHSGIGEVDLVRALEASSNPYFALLSGEFLDDPEDLCKAAHLFGFGEKTGVDLHGEYAGKLPADVTYNRTGLYSMSIGQHTLVGTPLQTALMLAAVANGGEVLKPYVVKAQIGAHGVLLNKKEVRRSVYMPTEIQEILLSGLKQVIWGEKGTARVLQKQFDQHLIRQVIGKTSTSEVIERMSLDGESSHLKLKHVWFGAIAYDSEQLDNPELVVVVYLRYGDWGKQAAPLAIEIIKKWRELKQKYSKQN